mmetsp:Transcript_2957/g.5253  ORF Transcript_2957/g.5253 Transcript_2957/m.5253 type:complete len:86 (+) Transcript_2957:121-378(+)
MCSTFAAFQFSTSSSALVIVVALKIGIASKKRGYVNCRGMIEKNGLVLLLSTASTAASPDTDKEMMPDAAALLAANNEVNDEVFV